MGNELNILCLLSFLFANIVTLIHLTMSGCLIHLEIIFKDLVFLYIPITTYYLQIKIVWLTLFFIPLWPPNIVPIWFIYLYYATVLTSLISFSPLTIISAVYLVVEMRICLFMIWLFVYKLRRSYKPIDNDNYGCLQISFSLSYFPITQQISKKLVISYICELNISSVSIEGKSLEP